MKRKCNLVPKVGNSLGFEEETAIQVVTAFLLGTIVHFFKLANYMVNHDTVVLIGNNGDWLITQGKWFVTPLSSLEGHLNLSCLSMLIGLAAFAVASALFCSILGVKKRWHRIGISLCFVAFPSVASMALYNSVSGFGLAFLLAMTAGYFFQKESVFGILIGTTLLTLSMGCYQAYLGVTLGVLVLDCMVRYLSDEDWKKVTIRGLKYIVEAIASIGMYYLILQIRLHQLNASLSSYKGMDNIGANLRPSVLLHSTKVAYKNALAVLTHDTLGIYGRRVTVWAVLLCAFSLLLLVAAACNLKKAKRVINGVFAFLMLLILPIAVNVIGIISANSSFYYITVAPFVLMFTVPLVLLRLLPENFWSEVWKQYSLPNVISGVISIAVLMNCWNWVVQDNTVYHKAMLMNKEYDVKMSAMIARIQSSEGYTQDSVIYLVGDAPYYFLKSTGALGAFEASFGTSGFGLGTSEGELYSPGLVCAYLRNMLSIDFIEGGQDEAMELYGSVIKEMPVYPAAGSIQSIDGNIVVRISETLPES